MSYKKQIKHNTSTVECYLISTEVQLVTHPIHQVSWRKEAFYKTEVASNTGSVK